MGVDHYVRIPKGTTIPVLLDFEGEEKIYNYVTKNNGAFYDTTAEGDVLQAKGK